MPKAAAHPTPKEQMSFLVLSRTLVPRAQEMRVANEWSAGRKPTVFQKTLEVNLESATQGVGEGTGGEGKQQAEEDERAYNYCADPT